MLKLKYSLVIGDSLFWDPYWKLQGREGCSHALRKIKEPNSQSLEPRGPNCAPLNPSLSWIVCDKVGMTLTLQIFEKSLCFETFTFFVCFFPTMLPSSGAVCVCVCVKITSANRCSSRRKKRGGREKKRELNHKMCPTAAAGFHTLLFLSQPGCCVLCLIAILRVEISGVSTPDQENVSPVSPARASFPFLD